MEVVSPRAPYDVYKGKCRPHCPARVWTETEAVFGDAFQWLTNLTVSRQRTPLQGQHMVEVR
jgi:hypothetical protein